MTRKKTEKPDKRGQKFDNYGNLEKTNKTYNYESKLINLAT